jgi:hypothetical protein
MKGPVLTVDAKVVCNHGGQVKVGASQHKLLVAGSPVLVSGDMEGKSVDGCVPPSGPPCKTVVSTTGGAAAVLKVDGKPALLASATGQTNIGTWSVLVAGQTKLVAS